MGVEFEVTDVIGRAEDRCAIQWRATTSAKKEMEEVLATTWLGKEVIKKFILPLHHTSSWNGASFLHDVMLYAQRQYLFSSVA